MERRFLGIKNFKYIHDFHGKEVTGESPFFGYKNFLFNKDMIFFMGRKKNMGKIINFD